MNMLIDTLSGLGSEWTTWAAVALLAVLGVSAFVTRLMCPYVCGKSESTVEEAQMALSRKIFAGPRFFIAMLFGIGITIAGLSLLYQNVHPSVGFLLVIGGVVVIQTEPIRLQIKESQNRVVAAAAMGEDARLAAVDGLRAKHHWLVGIHFLILIGVVAALFAF